MLLPATVILHTLGRSLKDFEVIRKLIITVQRKKLVRSTYTIYFDGVTDEPDGLPPRFLYYIQFETNMKF